MHGWIQFIRHGLVFNLKIQLWLQSSLSPIPLVCVFSFNHNKALSCPTNCELLQLADIVVRFTLMKPLFKKCQSLTSRNAKRIIKWNSIKVVMKVLDVGLHLRWYFWVAKHANCWILYWPQDGTVGRIELSNTYSHLTWLLKLYNLADNTFVCKF